MEPDALSFEDALGKLEETVRLLEKGELAIEDAVGLYEEGMRLARLCGDRLDAAALRITQLVPLASGEFIEEDLGESVV